MPARITVPDQAALAPLLQGERTAVARGIAALGGRVLLVGGSVRDLAMGVEPKDLDWEVHGLSPESLAGLLGNYCDVHQVGTRFGVLKVRLDGIDVDLALPRRESKAGRGHRGFQVEVDPTMTPREAAARRDFTWNAMAIDLNSGEFMDLFGGLDDLREGLIRHVGPAFAEDPLRVLRAMQFAARFGFAIAPETALLCGELFDEYRDLAGERVWMEWAKWAERGRFPSLGLEALRATRWIGHYPELTALTNCPQDPLFHPEGDVWTHTLLACDAAARIAERDGIAGADRLVAVLGALCHDLGKPGTTETRADGRITSAGHAEAGDPATVALLERIGFPGRLVPRVVSMVREHMSHISLAAGGFSDRGVRRLARRLEAAGNSVSLLGAVVESDHSGRPPLPGGMPQEMRRCLEQADGLDLLSSGPRQILLGRHLLDLGVAPGPGMGRILRAAMEAQLDGAFHDLGEAVEWARDFVRSEGRGHTD